MIKKSDFIIIIPAFNEEHTIEEVVRRAKEWGDVCVIDDSSTDSTSQILKRINGIHIITHEKNTHIPGAVLDGMRYALENGYNYAITMDAGLSHNPDEITLFLEQDAADLVIGSRIKKTNTPIYRKLLSLVGNFIYNISLDFPRAIFKKTYYKDINSGFRRYSKKSMNLLLSEKMQSRSFDFLFESAHLIYRNGLIISEVPISYNFSNSSLTPGAARDCLGMCAKTIFNIKT